MAAVHDASARGESEIARIGAHCYLERGDNIDHASSHGSPGREVRPCWRISASRWYPAE